MNKMLLARDRASINSVFLQNKDKGTQGRIHQHSGQDMFHRLVLRARHEIATPGDEFLLPLSTQGCEIGYEAVNSLRTLLGLAVVDTLDSPVNPLWEFMTGRRAGGPR